MSFLQHIITQAQQQPARIVLCEPHDPRVLSAGLKAQALGIAKIILVGDTAQIKNTAREIGADITPLQIEDPHLSEYQNLLRQALVIKRAHKGMTIEKAEELLYDPLYFANMLVHCNVVDGSVAGAVYSTADVVRCALQLIGKNPSMPIVSSFFIMLLNKPHHPHKAPVIFSDCGLVIDPSAEELAAITIAAIQSANALLNTEPRVAMLSFSTAGSASHPNVSKVIQAANYVKKTLPDIAIDEDVQFDAAIIPEIAAKKIKQSKVNGQANIFIFPNLEAGNIGYKIAERLGGVTAIGPLMQGLNKPANDLSRGCRQEDILNVIAVTTVQSQYLKNQKLVTL